MGYPTLQSAKLDNVAKINSSDYLDFINFICDVKLDLTQIKLLKEIFVLD